MKVNDKLIGAAMVFFFFGFCFIAPEVRTTYVRILFWGVLLPLEVTGFFLILRPHKRPNE